MDPLWGTQFTDEMIANPWMLDPTQKSNAFSPFNNKALQFPPTYAEGNMGGPVNAATGQLIPSYQAWKQANPGGMTLNQTPAQPAPAPQTYGLQPSDLAGPSALNPSGNQAYGMSVWGGMMSPQARDLYRNQQFAPPGSPRGTTYANMGQGQQQGTGLQPSGSPGAGGGMTQQQMMAGFTPLQQQWWAGAPANEKAQAMAAYGVGQQAAPQAAPQPTGPPNNWQAALQALANPGNPVTPGATVPQSNTFQPAGGVNQAFLGQAGGGNPNFMSALAAIQGRPRQSFG